MRFLNIIQKLRTATGLPCRECGGKGYVVDSGIAEFIEKNGLAHYQSASALMANEIHYGYLGSVPVGAWEWLGMSEDAAMDFATDVGHSHVLRSCPACNGQQNHDDALEAATDVIDRLIRNDRQRRSEWEASLTPEQLKASRTRKRHGRMHVAIRYAQQSRDFPDFDSEAAE